MNFYLIGVNYKSAPPEIRQKFYLERRQIEDFWKGVSVLDSAVLVTCNRFDISIVAESQGKISSVLKLFESEFPEFYAHSYLKEDAPEVFRYGLRLACGLESQLKGELQIFEQLKIWLNQNQFPQTLFEFWSQIIELAREIRFKSGLSYQDVNIAKLLFEDLKNLRVNSDKLAIVVVGTGKVADLIAECKPYNAQLYFVAHKNRSKAKALAGRVNARILTFEQLKQIIPDVQVLVSAASSPHIILRVSDIPDSVLVRAKPLYVYDFGFPMNVDKELGYRKNIILKNLNDLVSSVNITSNYLTEKLNLVEYLIEERIKDYEFAKDRDKAQSACH
jgi:glutamyl-tRNA reductase